MNAILLSSLPGQTSRPGLPVPPRLAAPSPPASPRDTGPSPLPRYNLPHSQSLPLIIAHTLWLPSHLLPLQLPPPCSPSHTHRLTFPASHFLPLAPPPTRLGRTAHAHSERIRPKFQRTWTTLEANQIFRDQGDIRKIPGVTSLVAQILQWFLSFYVQELCDWALC